MTAKTCVLAAGHQVIYAAFEAGCDMIRVAVAKEMLLQSTLDATRQCIYNSNVSSLSRKSPGSFIVSEHLASRQNSCGQESR